VLYVDADAPTGGDGASWATAFNRLEDALAVAQPLTEVWVAQGTYTPDGGTGDRTRTFAIQSLVEVYGGFNGTETLRSERDWVNNITILSGDLAGNDGAPGSFTNYGENAYHVVRLFCAGFPCTEPSTLDGFTIIGGNADKPNDTTHRIGAGVFGAEGATYANLRIMYNQAVLRGAGMMSDRSATVSLCAFIGNRCISSPGGALYVDNNTVVEDCLFDSNTGEVAAVATPSTGDLRFERCTFQNNAGNRTVYITTNESFQTEFIDCDFISNIAAPGSSRVLECALNTNIDMHGCTFSDNVVNAFISRGSLTMNNCEFTDNLNTAFIAAGTSILTNVVFTGNVSNGSNTGGGMQVDGGANGVATLVHCEFYNNVGGEGGGLNVNDRDSIATLSLCTFSGNTATGRGDGIYNEGTLNFANDVDISDGLVNARWLRPGGDGAAGSMDLPAGLTNAVIPIQNAQPLKGTLFADIGGDVQGTLYDVFNAGASAVSIEGGTLQIQFFNDFVPEEGDSFELIKGGSLTGLFDIVTSPATLPAGLYMDLVYDVDSLTATFQPLDNLISLSEDASLSLSTLPLKTALADLNGDDLPELLLLYPGADAQNDPGELIVHINAGFDGDVWQGFDAASSPIAVGVDPRDLIVGRFNGDEWTDVAIPCTGSNAIIMFINAADATGDLLPGTDVAVDLGLSAVGVVPTTTNASDLIVVAREYDDKKQKSNTNVMREYINDGFGSFTKGLFITSPDEGTIQIRVADVDLDLDNDVITLYGASSPTPGDQPDVRVYHYNSEKVEYDFVLSRPVGFDAVEIVIADVNRNGYPDIMTEDFTDDTISILFNEADGSGLFQWRESIFVGDNTKSLHAVDLDLDDDPDFLFIAKGSSNEPVVRYTRNDSTAQGQFILATTTDVGTAVEPLRLIAGDVDNDQTPDVIVFEASSELATAGSAISAVVYRNQLDIGFCLGDLVDNATFQPPPDGQVDGADLAFLLSEWGVNPGSLADIVSNATFQPPPDGLVDGADLAAMLGAWGACD